MDLCCKILSTFVFDNFHGKCGWKDFRGLNQSAFSSVDFIILVYKVEAV